MAADSILVMFLLLGISNSMPSANGQKTIPLPVFGFEPNIYEIFNSINYLLGSENDNQTLKEVMGYVTEEFAKTMNNLRYIEKMLTEKEVNVYQNVQAAVVDGIKDVKSRSTTDVGYRAVALNNQLNILSDGLLGVSTATPDLLKSLKNLYSCGSRSMNVTMEKVVTLLNIGAVGISYYSKVFDNAEKFDGYDHIKTLADKKDAILQRLQREMKTCAALEYPTITGHISNVLSLMLNSSTVGVNRALYERLSDIYYPLGLSWVFYTALNFKAGGDLEILPTDRKFHSIHMECLDNCGEINIGDMSVIWAFARPTNPPAGPIKNINIAAFNDVVDSLKWQDSQARSAFVIERKLRQYNIVTSDSRSPVFWLIVENPSPTATFLPYPDTQLNVASYSYTSSWIFYVLLIPFPFSVTVDILVL